VEAFGVLIKFKMALPWKPRYQNNGVGCCPLCFVMAILVTSPRLLSGDVLLFYVSFSLWEYHIPCEVVLLRVDFFKMAAVAMETAKMLKN
jgi:hypothetical protein